MNLQLPPPEPWMRKSFLIMLCVGFFTNVLSTVLIWLSGTSIFWAIPSALTGLYFAWAIIYCVNWMSDNGELSPKYKRMAGVRHIRWAWAYFNFFVWWNLYGCHLGVFPNQSDMNRLDDIWSGKQ